MYCNMYLVPFNFVDKKEIKFPKDYKKKFKTFKTGDDILIAYAETMIIMQRWDKLASKKKAKNALMKKVLKIKDQLYKECFTTAHQSIMFHSPAMTEQFNYIYYLILTSLKELEK